VRASRLVSILLLLQARGRMTAQALAAELEVSGRTIYRDIEALVASGVPVIGEPGHDGGYRLLDGYRTRLTGLTPAEAAAVPLAPLPGIATALGLGSEASGAAAKIKAALAADLRERADHVERRLHIDASGWYSETGDTPLLSAVADAVWTQRQVRVRYRRWADPPEVDRTLDPFGLVLKGGHWYVVAQCGDDLRTYRVSQLLLVEPTGSRFDRPGDFDLVAYWRGYLAEFDSRRHLAYATVRLSPAGLARLAHVGEPSVVRAVRSSASAPDGDGWVRATLPIESVRHAHGELLRLGAEVEVLEPAELRTELAATAQTMASHYGVCGR